MGALRFDPNRPDGPARLWVGLWGVWGSGHVAFSDDLGKTWVSRAGGLPNEPVYTLALVPGREGRLYAGTLSGVWGTEDGGESWRRLTGDLPEVQKVTSLLVDADQPDTVIAGTWRRAYKSDDGGRTWAGVFEGMVLDSEVFSLTPVPGRAGRDLGHHLRLGLPDPGPRREVGALQGGVRGAAHAELRRPARRPAPRRHRGRPPCLGRTAARPGSRVGDPALSIQGSPGIRSGRSGSSSATEGAGVWVSEDGAATFRPSTEGMTNTRISALARSARSCWSR